jgi:hypothetical protein
MGQKSFMRCPWPMLDLASTVRIVERGKVLNQFLDRHRHPPFVDEGTTGMPVRPSNPASPFHASSLRSRTFVLQAIALCNGCDPDLSSGLHMGNTVSNLTDGKSLSLYLFVEARISSSPSHPNR